jgi:hypothetical protein
VKKKDIDFIKQWFYSDLDIQIRLGKKKYDIITLENNAWYGYGERHKGEHRTIYAIEEMCDDTFEAIKDYCSIEYNLVELLETLKTIKERTNLTIHIL